MECRLVPARKHQAGGQQTSTDSNSDGTCSEGTLEQDSTFCIDHGTSPMERGWLDWDALSIVRVGTLCGRRRTDVIDGPGQLGTGNRTKAESIDPDAAARPRLGNDDLDVRAVAARSDPRGT
ncbi:hypothetical protein THIOKS11770014 [Thiocapsa sp. KS1]|nr:hypothetical protein THIOKS11770014 [Thiocapsa sp. KS1]